VETPPRKAVGHGCTEAPRGTLYHRYELGEDGTILDARIIPPTAQSQPTIEDSLRAFLADKIAASDRELKLHSERLIRSYDPCISCSAHFLNLQVERE
jgi:coenzyme F420-reducing hydrogenase alpha subunit